MDIPHSKPGDVDNADINFAVTSCPIQVIYLMDFFSKILKTYVK